MTEPAKKIHDVGDVDDIPRPSGSVRLSSTVISVLNEWSADGPLIHEPTGIARLDELTDGGPVYGSRWYLAGAPDAGKTAFLIQLAHIYALRGLAVGLLAVDEEAGDLVTRLAQRVGYGRGILEARGPETLAGVRREIGDLPIRIYDGSWTIEGAAADLATFARERAAADPEAHPNGPRAMLGIDSLQTVTCDAELSSQATGGHGMSTTEAVTARVQAIRAAATRHRLIPLTTSEMGRGAYRTSDPAERTSTMAAGKWSGAIEYSARVLLGLRSVAGETDLIEIDVAKNKHGPSGEFFYLRIDRRSQMLTESAYEPEPDDRGATRDSAARERVSSDAVAVARILAAHPGLGLRELRGAIRAATGAGVERVGAALAFLGDAVVRGTGAKGARPMTLDSDALPEATRAALEEMP